ncbi:MAG TPA: polysaccharide biosynthesis tyrosine autokinase [Bacteroidales bacterium]|nr:polysaccharide biosynthesis tyrosine autokinase [Bacteroidales bacterium]
MQTTDPNSEFFQQPQEIDYRRYLIIVLRKWYWLVLCGLVGMAVAYFSNQLKQPVYTASSTIVIPSQSNSLDLRSLFSGSYYTNYADIYNQMTILRSYTLNRQVLQNISWRTSWFTKKEPGEKSISSVKKATPKGISRYLRKVLIWQEVYPNNLFNVTETEDAPNPSGIPLYITPVSGDEYIVRVEMESSGGAGQGIAFEERGYFGRPFANSWFSFTLDKKPGAVLGKDWVYYFTFNDLNQQTGACMGTLSVALKDDYSDVVQLQMSGSNPQRIVEYINELIRTYIAEKLERSTETQRRSIEFIDSQLLGISDSLSQAGAIYSAFRARNQILDLGTKGTQVMQNLENIDGDLARNRMQLEYLRNLQSYIERADLQDKVFAPSVVGIEDLLLNGLIVKLGDLYNRRQVLSVSARENNPSLILLNQEILQTINLLKENIRNLIDNALVVIRDLERQKQDANLQLNELPVKEQSLINIQRKYDLTNEIYTFLLQKRAEIYITLASSVSDIQLIDPARMQTVGVTGTSSSRKVLTGLLLGLAIPLLIIVVISYLDDSIASRGDVEQNTRLPIVGNIIHSGYESPVPVLNHPHSSFTESFRSIRTNLQYLLSDPLQKIISIQSTSPEEGKSFIAVNLACILAVNEKKVLLAGCDLRKPSLHKYFDASNQKGISTWLIGNNTFEEIILSTDIENLWLAPSGPIPPNPAELLGKPELKSFLDRSREMFDYIILDNAPVSIVTDGLLTGRLADLNLFVLRANSSHKKMIKLINHLAEIHALNNITLLINDIKITRFGNKYSYYSGSQSTYPYGRYKKGYYDEEVKRSSLHRLWRKLKHRLR